MLVKAYGVVYRARHTPTSRVVALKQVRILPDERQNGVPITALREISILRSLKHINIINVIDVAVGDTEMDEIYMAMEYVEQVGDPFAEGSSLKQRFRKGLWAQLAGLLFLCRHVGGCAGCREFSGSGESS